MDTLFWIFLPAFAAVAAGLLAWFNHAVAHGSGAGGAAGAVGESRGALRAERTAMEGSLDNALRAAEEGARRQAFDNFLAELRVEQRHYTHENRMLTPARASLVLQERMFFRNIPLSDWIEHEIPLDDATDVNRLGAGHDGLRQCGSQHCRRSAAEKSSGLTSPDIIVDMDRLRVLAIGCGPGFGPARGAGGWPGRCGKRESRVSAVQRLPPRG